jgi:phosphatidylglycerol:prolipoprotein diacylglycerol transferase
MQASSSIAFPGLGIEINPPEGFSIASFTVKFYGIAIALGLLLAVIYGLKRKKQFGLKEDDILDGVLGIVPFAIICARAYYCIFSWKTFAANPLRVLYIWEGGLAIYGGVIGAALGVVVFCLIKKIKLGTVLDLVALGFLIGQCVGRWGNFFNREAYGAETESFLRMGLHLTASGSETAALYYYHPTFLYESLWNLAGFVILHFLSKKRQYDGQIALGYAVWYGFGRTLIEGLRTDSLYLGQFRVSQLLAAFSCFAAAVALIVLAFRKHSASKLYVNVIAAQEALAEAEAQPEETPDALSEEQE